MKPFISVIIPVYNEEKVITGCLESLKKQTYKPIEIIIVDDGSTDKTLETVKNFKFSPSVKTSEGEPISNFKLLRQEHRGPGPARNLGAKNAKGEILVFVDADMTFDRNFLRDLTLPILQGKTIGTFSKNEMVKNSDNIWSICWNINKNLPIDRMIPNDYPNTAPVFRAILKEKFDEVAGFDTTGQYTDDWSLSRKLGTKSTVVKDAIYYHSNPLSLKEVWQQARWIGKNEFISGTFLRQVRSLIQYSLPVSLIVGIYKSVIYCRLLVRRSSERSRRDEIGLFVFFKVIYDQAIFISVVGSFFGESKSK